MTGGWRGPSRPSSVVALRPSGTPASTAVAVITVVICIACAFSSRNADVHLAAFNGRLMGIYLFMSVQSPCLLGPPVRSNNCCISLSHRDPEDCRKMYSGFGGIFVSRKSYEDTTAKIHAAGRAAVFARSQSADVSDAVFYMLTPW